MTFTLTFLRWWAGTFELLCLIRDVVEYIR